MGHNYLLSAFLSPKLNRRRDGFGGDVAGGPASPGEVAIAVRDAVAGPGGGDGQAQHGRRGPGRTVARRQRRGGSPARGRRRPRRPRPSPGAARCRTPCTCSGGRRRAGSSPPPCPGPARLGFRLVGRRFMLEYPFEEAFFLPYARQFRAALAHAPRAARRASTGSTPCEQALDEDFSFVAMARALLREPDLVDALRADADARVAVHPLQQVHAHHLPGHPLRAGTHAGATGAAPRRPARRKQPRLGAPLSASMTVRPPR